MSKILTAKALVGGVIQVLLFPLVLFLAAGTLAWPAGWIFLILFRRGALSLVAGPVLAPDGGSAGPDRLVRLYVPGLSGKRVCDADGAHPGGAGPCGGVQRAI